MNDFDDFFLKSMTYTNMKVTCESNKLINEVVEVCKPIKNNVDEHKLVIPQIEACQSRQSVTITKLQKAISRLEKTVKERFERFDERITELEQDKILNERDIADIRSMIFCQNKEVSNCLPS